MKNLAHVVSRFVNTPLMIHPPKLEVIIKALGPRLGIEIEQVEFASEDEQTLKLEAKYNSDANADSGFYMEDNVAVIPVQGTLMKRLSGIAAWSGGCSYLGLRDQIQSAMDDGRVQGVLLDIDSPGGETTGCFELADFIYGLRGSKPIYAVANDCAASA